MATLYSALGQKQQNALSVFAANALTTREITPGFRLLELIYTVTGAEAAADIIRWIKLPAGSIVLPGYSKIAARAALATTAFTLGVGDDGGGSNAGAVAADAARYDASTDKKAAVTTVATQLVSGTAAVTPFVAPAEMWVQSTLGTTTLPLAGAVLILYLAYKDGS